MIALDDNIEDHPKFVSLSDAAFALWVRCIGYCRRNLTDGYVPEQAARARIRSGKPEKVIAELCSPPAGLPNGNPLWLKVLGGYQVHDYLEWNPSKEQVEELREKKRAAAARGGQASGRTRAKQAAERNEPGSLPAASTKDEAPCFDSGSPLAKSDPIRSGSDPRSLPEPLVLLELPAGAPAASTTAAAATAMTERQQAILAELRAHKALAGIADRALAETLDGRAISNGKPLELVFRAIRDAAADVQPGTKLEEVRKRVRTYADNAKPPRAGSPGTRARPVQPMTRPEDCVPPADPNDPAHTFEEPMEPLL